MAYLKLQGLTSLQIAPSDDAPIPLPTSPHFSGLVTGVVGTTIDINSLLGAASTTTAGTGGFVGQSNTGGISVIDTTASFLTDGVEPNDFLQNDTNNQTARVYYVISETELVVFGSDTSFIGVGDAYFIISRNNFANANVKVGDIIVNNATFASTTINGINDFESALITTNIFGTPPPSVSYTVYTEPNANLGCILYVGGTGDINCVTASGQTVLFSAVPQGIWMPVQVKQVLETGTTATLLVANW
jgi:hypothetical protein